MTYEAHDDADADEEAGPEVCEQNESGEENADESEAQVAIEFLLDDLKSTKLSVKSCEKNKQVIALRKV